MNIKHKIILLQTSLTTKYYFLKCWFRKSVLRKKTYYNSQYHNGNLPIRVLQHNILHWLEVVSPVFFQTMLEEIKNNGLEKGISYHIDGQPILHVAQLNAASISAKRKISIYETFNAYLWCISYSLLVGFDEIIQKPHLKGNYTGEINLNNKQIKSVIDVFSYGMSLRTAYHNWDYTIPNPEKFDCDFSFYVEKANSVFVSAMFFVLSHEIGHSYYSHVSYIPATAEQSKQEELDADNFAIAQVLSCKDNNILPSLKYGAVIGMCSLLFLSPKLYKNGSYPDADNRIRNVMEKLDLKDLDLHWGVASLAFRLWGNHFGINFTLPTSSKNYQELFYDVLHQMNTIKRNENRR